MRDQESQTGPVFIFGAPRSGTSMLHWSLAQHPNLWGSAESDFLEEIVLGGEKAWEAGTRYGDYHWLVTEGVSREEFLLNVGHGIDALYRSRSSGARWLDQTPGYILHYRSLSIMFPDACFIHIVRDGRQAVNSMQKKFGWSFRKCLRTWKLFVCAGQRQNASKAPNFLQVRYEDLVVKPAEYLQRVFAFIGEEFCEASLTFLQNPINSAPGLENESPMDKLRSDRVPWGPARNAAFKLACGAIQRQMGYSDA